MIFRFILKLRKRYKKFILQHSTFKTIENPKKKIYKREHEFLKFITDEINFISGTIIA